ncbi:MAG: adenylyltransferase/cytidyltransferase family protein [Puniceicoccales bacterium]|jgi:D-beta-D-heptose 7-phosphate kinase/D-beta-D-heptose 1-phosphate adenosyltransferase|nr:adenylyltransferase/cytidyltransferase family protein [Puniceicoccales bacterium]
MFTFLIKILENYKNRMGFYYIVSGGFDPIHEGHISLIKDASSRSDGVIVLLNSDAWLCRKKGKNFMKFATRIAICENLKNVIDVLGFDDDDNSACNGIRKAREKYHTDQLVFANGGDRTAENIPEIAVCKECGVMVEFGVGGANKMNSSSSILKHWG